MKNQIALRLLKYTLSLVMFLNFSSCSDELELIDTESQLKQENTTIESVSSKVSAKPPVVVGSFNVPQSICAGEEAEFCFDVPTGTNLQVQQYDEDLQEWVQVYQISKSVTNPQCFTLTFDTAGDYQLRYKIGNGGFTEVAVTVLNCGCDESFSYVDNGGGSYTFTYIPAENMTNVNVVFTFAQGVNVIGLDGWNENGVTRQMGMDLVACKTYSWTVELTPKCSGNSPNSNVWTDFKVENNDGDTSNDSKKNISEPTPNIVRSCS